MARYRSAWMLAACVLVVTVVAASYHGHHLLAPMEWSSAPQEVLRYQNGDLVLGFRAGSHEVVSITGVRDDTTSRAVLNADVLLREYRGPLQVQDLDTKTTRQIPLAANSRVLSPQFFSKGDLVSLQRIESERDHRFGVDFVSLRSGQKHESFSVVSHPWLGPFIGVCCPDGLTCCCIVESAQLFEPRKLQCFDVTSGRQLYTKSFRRLSFSGDGNRAALTLNDLDGQVPPGPTEVFDVRSGKTLASLAINSVSGLSHDGLVILDASWNVWEVATARKRFSLGGPSCFVLQGQALARTQPIGPLCLFGQTLRRESILVTVHDVQTGAETARLTMGFEADRPNVIRSKPTPRPVTPDGRLIELEDYPPSTRHLCVLVDVKAARIVFQTPEYLKAVSDDGKYVATTVERETGEPKIWRVEP